MLPDTLKCVLLQIILIISRLILPTKSVSIEIYKERLLQNGLVYVNWNTLDSLKED